MSISALAFAGLEEALNRYLSLDPSARKSMERLHGRVIAFEILGLALTLYLIPGPGRLQLVEIYEGEPDCCISGTPLALARMGDHQANSDQLFTREVEITGDSQLAHQLGMILSDMEIDWEEQLSRVTGDLIAHRLGNLWRGTLSWGTNTATTLNLNIQEYLQQELRLLPSRLEIEHFLAGVDTLRDDVDRLQARINRLQQQQAKS